jgi:hypothetical protein
MSIGNILFFIGITLLLISEIILAFVFGFDIFEKETTIVKKLLKYMYSIFGIGGFVSIVSLVFLYFELGGIK